MAHVGVAQWLTIDAVLDNVHAVENVDGDRGVAAQAFRLRQLGWDANASHPDRGQGPVGWPPRDAYLRLALTDGDLAFIRDFGPQYRHYPLPNRQLVDRPPEPCGP